MHWLSHIKMARQTSYLQFLQSCETPLLKRIKFVSNNKSVKRFVDNGPGNRKVRRLTVKIYDQLGKEIFAQSEFAIKGNNTYHVDLSNGAAGVYYLEVINNQEQNRVKFVIEK